MVEYLKSLGVTPNEIDTDVGEDGEEDKDEDEELGHGLNSYQPGCSTIQPSVSSAILTFHQT